MTTRHQGNELREALKSLPETISDIASKRLGMTRQNLNHHLRKPKLDNDFLRLIKEKLGIALVENRFSTKGKKFENARLVENEDVNVMLVPVVNQYAYAGYLRGYTDAEYLESLPRMPWMVDKEYKGNYFTFEVRGDSMDDGTRDSYISGDLLLCREIGQDLWKTSKLHIRNWDFVIVHKTEGILVKKITEHNVTRSMLKLHSLNNLYPDFEVNLKDIAQIFNVVQVARKK
jgi:phage repressor protein C with HTH and peptisase S24 domain